MSLSFSQVGLCLILRYPLRCVCWPPAYGHYMATGGADGTASLYACDHAPQPLRIFTGHRSDVTSLAFHPNVNYLATGSADRAVRLFDVRSGKAVRLYTGHKVGCCCGTNWRPELKL